jgi:hypothetical protein
LTIFGSSGAGIDFKLALGLRIKVGLFGSDVLNVVMILGLDIFQ